MFKWTNFNRQGNLNGSIAWNKAIGGRFMWWVYPTKNTLGIGFSYSGPSKVYRYFNFYLSLWYITFSWKFVTFDADTRYPYTCGTRFLNATTTLQSK